MVFLLVFGIIGLIFCIFGVKNPNNDKDLKLGVFSLFSCLFMVGLGLYLLFL